MNGISVPLFLIEKEPVIFRLDPHYSTPLAEVETR